MCVWEVAVTCNVVCEFPVQHGEQVFHMGEVPHIAVSGQNESMNTLFFVFYLLSKGRFHGKFLFLFYRGDFAMLCTTTCRV